ncbi:MAG: tRNA pseudouridine(55) synthase TruB, partial [Bdellovibrionota bacterium]|nr:tRNA pseudouridine(55) synthase TruB [Bdellovibrionota bacterium]
MNQIDTFPEGPFILNVLKPTKITSSVVVNRFKRLLPKGKKIGHFGTLDPFACGVLMLGIAGGSRLNDFVHKYLPKTYLALGKLGFNTETGDITGQVINEKPHENNFNKSHLQALLREKFIGPYWQAPPAFSAVKHKGKALYKWAREGEVIKKEPVLRQVYSLDVVSSNGPFVLFRVQ